MLTCGSCTDETCLDMGSNRSACDAFTQGETEGPLQRGRRSLCGDGEARESDALTAQTAANDATQIICAAIRMHGLSREITDNNVWTGAAEQTQGFLSLWNVWFAHVHDALTEGENEDL